MDEQADDFDADGFYPIPDVTVFVTDPEPIGTLLGPDGEPLHTVLPPDMPFGFSK